MTSAAPALEPPADTRADAEHMAEQFKTLAGSISGSRLASAAGVRVAGWEGESADRYTASSAALGGCAVSVVDALVRAAGAIETWRDHLAKMIDVTVPDLQERYQRAQAQYEAGFADLQARAASMVATGQPMGVFDGLQARNREMAAARDQAHAEILEDYRREMGLLDQTAADAASEIDASIGTVAQDPVAAGALAAFGAGKGSLNVMPGKWGDEDEDYRDGRRDPEGSEEDGTSSGSAPGLGAPVPGEDAPMPRPKPWEYSGDTELEGSGEHGQRDATLGDQMVHETAGLAALALAPMWPDASENLLHYLGNSGEPKDVDVDQMLDDLPKLQNGVDDVVQDNVNSAVADAKSSGATGPVTYPFVSEWRHQYANKNDNENWFYATGGFQYSVAGTVTVYPPSDANGEWTYSYDTQTHMADRYNWDGQKGVDIGPLHVTDKQLQELHQAGIAQEYDLVGESSVSSGP